MIQIGSPPATIDSPIEHLVACHRRIEQRLDTLVNAADHFTKDRQSALAAIARSLHFLDTNGVLHTEDEEASLFPRLRPKVSPSELAFIDTLESQHAEAESIYAELKRAAAQLNLEVDLSPDSLVHYRDCAERLRSLYRPHIRSEDQILTGIAMRSLEESELAGISREMRERRAVESKSSYLTGRL